MILNAMHSRVPVSHGKMDKIYITAAKYTRMVCLCTRVHIQWFVHTTFSEDGGVNGVVIMGACRDGVRLR